MAKLDDDTMRVVRRNKLLGMWAAEKLGFVGERAEAYSNDLAMAALEFERSDVLAKLRKDFKDAGVVQSDEELLQVMSEFWLRAQRQTGRRDPSEAAIVQIARNLGSI
jgi:hypothetical protein